MLEDAELLSPQDVLERVAHLSGDARYNVECALAGAELVLRMPGGRLAGPLQLDVGTFRQGSQAIDALLVEGDLSVAGGALNLDGDSGPLLVVLGDLRATAVVHGGGTWIVAGNVIVAGTVVGFYNHGYLWVGGRLDAETLITDDHAVTVLGEIHARRIGDEGGREQLVPEVIDFFESEPTRLLVDTEALTRRVKAGKPVLRAPGKLSLHHAVEAGDIPALSWIPRRGIDAGDARGATALMLAARTGRVEIVRALLAAGARALRADRDGRTALHWAAGCGVAEVVEVLLAAGAAIEATDREGRTPLVRAVESQDRQVALALVRAGARLDVGFDSRPLLLLALGARGGPGVEIDEALALALLAAGVPREVVDRQGLTPLVQAATLASPALVEALLAAGADPRQPGPQGVTALEAAALFARPQAARLLLAPVAPDALLGESGRRLLAFALVGPDALSQEIASFQTKREQPDRLELARLLIAAGVRPDGAFAGWPLTTLNPDPGVLELLLQAGADPDALDGEGVAPLVRALADAPVTRDRALVRLLLKYGADPTRRTPEGESPAELAAATGDRELLDPILDALRQRAALAPGEAEALIARAMENSRRER